jgi:hypothetical protein
VILTLAGSLPQVYILFASPSPGRFVETYLPGTAAALIGLALYARSLERSIAWAALAILNPYGPLFTLGWLHPAAGKDPRLRVLLPLLFAYGLGYDLIFFRGEYARLAPSDLQALALSGILLGLVDPSRGMIWAATLLLPSFLHALRILPEVGRLDHLAGWFTGMFFPIVHATFGGHFGSIAGWLVTRAKRGDAGPAHSIPHGCLLLLSLVVVGGLDPYVSLVYGGSLRLHDSWSHRLLAGLMAGVIGLPLGHALVTYGLTHAREGPATITDRRGIGESLGWCFILLVIGIRRVVFETCAAVGRHDFTQCLDASDFPSLASLGLAVGLVAGIYQRAAREESTTRSPLTVQLGPLRTWNRTTAIATLVFAGFNMGIGSWNVLEPAPAEPVRPTRIAFVPLGAFPDQTLHDLADHYRRSFGLAVDVLPAVPLARRAFTYQREQLIAEALIALIQQRHRPVAANPTVLVVGFTTHDMYSCSLVAYGFPYCDLYQPYALDARRGGRLAMISSYRLDPARYGKSPDPPRVEARLRTLTTRAIGLLYHQYPVSQDPHSVLFPATRPEELDVMRDSYLPP